MTTPPSPLRRAAESGFTLIEVIVAMTILSVVVAASAFAVVSGDSAQVRVATVADTHAVAEKAVERARGDLSARSLCDSSSPGWKSQSRTALANSGPASYSPCQFSYNGMRDSKGRNYLVLMTVTPVDEVADGTGSGDADGNLRDHYDVTTTTQLASDSTAGREEAKPVTVAGSLDWDAGSTDGATVTVVACAIDRPDASLIGGMCNAGDASRQPLAGVTVTLSPSSEAGNHAVAGSITTGSSGQGVAMASVEAGAYELSAPAAAGSYRLFKLDQPRLRVTGSQSYTVHVTYMRNASSVTVCTQIGNYSPPDDGYEVTSTNLYYRRTENAGLRSMQLNLASTRDITRPNPNPADRDWKCAGNEMVDPLQFDGSNLFRGLYDIEVQQEDGGGMTGLSVTGLSWDCSTGLAWNQPLDGSLLINRSYDPQLDHTTAGYSAGSVYRRFALKDSSSHRLCIRFYDRQFVRESCSESPAGSGAWYGSSTGLGNCFYTGSSCALPNGVVDNDSDCWNGADVCTANCNGSSSTPGGTVGSVEPARPQNAGVTGGPNDKTVGCSTQTTYSWPPRNKLLGAGPSTLVPMATILSHDWVGGSTTYYANFNGTHAARTNHRWGVAPDTGAMNRQNNPPYFCNEVSFSCTPDLCKGPFPFYTCLEATFPYNGQTVRGLVLDTSGGTNDLYVTVGGALALAPSSNKFRDYWNPFSGSPATNYPMATSGTPNWANFSLRKVLNDPVCNSGGGGGSTPAPVTTHYDPIITEYWLRINDEPAIRPSPGAPGATNVTTDDSSV